MCASVQVDECEFMSVLYHLNVNTRQTRGPMARRMRSSLVSQSVGSIVRSFVRSFAGWLAGWLVYLGSGNHYSR